MSDPLKDERMREILRQAGASFLEYTSNKTSLITVTSVVLQDRGARAIFLVTVFPDDKEAEALEFLKRQRSDLRAFIEKETRLTRIPLVDFALDLGEKNRQRIDALSNNS